MGMFIPAEVHVPENLPTRHFELVVRDEEVERERVENKAENN